MAANLQEDRFIGLGLMLDLRMRTIYRARLARSALTENVCLSSLSRQMDRDSHAIASIYACLHDIQIVPGLTCAYR